jgi:dihydrolipoamide dehydrogenase
MVMGDLVNEVDVAVLGGGPGGYSAAFRCAELGLETVVVDAGKRLGGACLYEGCIPSKALLHVAAVIGEAERAKEFGLDFGEPRISLDPLRKWKAERVVGKLSRGLASVAKAKKVEVVGGRGAFEDSRSIRVGGDEPQVIRFKHAIIATGSLPSRAPGLDLVSDRIMDSTGALELPEIPERLLVIGGGYIGLELGQVYAALGSRVTVVEMTDGLLPGADRDLVQPLQRRCEKMFAAIHLKSKVTGLKEVGGAIEAAIEGQETQPFDRVLIAVGRRAVSDGLGLETTKAEIGERGLIAVDERCRTADPHIYAVGDVTGDPMLAHRAMRQGKVAAEAIAGRPSAFDNVAVPAVVFTDPEVAWVGLMEAEAQRAGRQIKVAKFPWAASGRAASIGRSDGLTKLVVDAAARRVLGVGIVGPGAGELIAEASLAVETAVTAEDLALTIHAHPTLSEGLMEAAESLLHQGGAS